MYSRNDGSMGKLMVTESFNSLIFLEIFVSWCLLGIASGSSSLWVWVIISNQRLQGTHCRLVLFKKLPPLAGHLRFCIVGPMFGQLNNNSEIWMALTLLLNPRATICTSLLTFVAGCCRSSLTKYGRIEKQGQLFEPMDGLRLMKKLLRTSQHQWHASLD